MISVSTIYPFWSPVILTKYWSALVLGRHFTHVVLEMFAAVFSTRARALLYLEPTKYVNTC